MTVIVSPYLRLASVSDRDKYLSLVRDVAHDTQANELECLAYCWTREVSGTESSEDSSPLVQGLEVYRTPEALAVTHRSSAPYRHMREVVATTGLLSYPKGGVPTYVPAGAGFLWKEGAVETVSAEDYFVVVQYTADGRENLARVLEEERLLSAEMESIDGVLAFWPFVPNGTGEQVSITIFIRLVSINHYRDVIEDRIHRFEAVVLNYDGVAKTRSWGGHGFGFFRRQESLHGD